MPYQNDLPPTTGPSILDWIKQMYGTNTNGPNTPSAADIAYAQAQQQADSSAGSAITNAASTVGSAINNGLNTLFNLPPQDPTQNAPDIGPNTGSGAPQAFGGTGGQATDVIPAGLLAAVGNQSAPQPTDAQLAGVVGPTASPQASQAQAPINTPIADPTAAPDVTLDANGNPIDPSALPDPQNLSNTDREAATPFENSLGLFNQQASQLAANPDPVAAKGLLGQFGDTLAGYSAKLKALSPAASQGLLQTGLGILQNNDGKHPLSAIIGAGGTQGVNAYTQAKQLQVQNSAAQAKATLDNANLMLNVAKYKSEDSARQDATSAKKTDLQIAQQNADTNTAKANAEMNGTSKWVTVQMPDGSYVQQGYNKNGNATTTLPASADDIQKLKQGQAPNEAQSKAAGYANRLAQNEGVIQGTYSSMQGPGGIWNSLAPNVLKSTNYQEYTAAKSNWISALLRQESGAAIAPSEFAGADKQYFPQPGDSQAVIDQKAALRATAAQGMVTAAGPNYKPTSNTPQPQQGSSSASSGNAQAAQAAQANVQTTLQKYQVAARNGNVAAQQQLKQRGYTW